MEKGKVRIKSNSRTPNTRTSLNPAEWVRAAYRAIARGGVEAVAVEPIAAELGTTKGSFYWHFKDRDALVTAALNEWERRLTDNVVRRLEREPDPAQRLWMLLDGAFHMRAADRSAEIALLAHTSHGTVRRRVRRVTKRRIAYIATQLETLGWEPGSALDRAVILFYLYVGQLQTAHIAPQIASNETRLRHVKVAFHSLIVPDPAPDPK